MTIKDKSLGGTDAGHEDRGGEGTRIDTKKLRKFCDPYMFISDERGHLAGNLSLAADAIDELRSQLKIANDRLQAVRNISTNDDLNEFDVAVDIDTLVATWSSRPGSENPPQVTDSVGTEKERVPARAPTQATKAEEESGLPREMQDLLIELISRFGVERDDAIADIVIAACNQEIGNDPVGRHIMRKQIRDFIASKKSQ